MIIIKILMDKLGPQKRRHSHIFLDLNFAEWPDMKWGWSKQGTLTEGGRLSTVDLLVQLSLEQLIFKLKILFTFGTLMRRSTVLSLPRQLGFPGVSLCDIGRTMFNFMVYFLTARWLSTNVAFLWNAEEIYMAVGVWGRSTTCLR